MYKFSRKLKMAMGTAFMCAALAVDGAGIVSAQAPVVGSVKVEKGTHPVGSVAKVYYTKHLDAAHLIKLYDKINEGIYGKVALKLHTGEPNGPYILPREWIKAFQEHVPNSTICDTNTLYVFGRDTTKKNRETQKLNGWTFSPVDILDEDGGVDFPVRNGKVLDHVNMGSHLANYDSMVVLTHFKGHAMGGYGGSMKNIGIGNASGQVGKRQVHGYFEKTPPDGIKWGVLQDGFMERMADSAKATCDHFGKHIVFINVLRKMSVDCDCAGTTAAKPTIPDLGMMASTDILAIDQASVDMVYAQQEKDKHDLVERIESRHGLHQLTAMKNLKLGNPQYELINVD
jgi:uncharacterized Fe-S center protein